MKTKAITTIMITLFLASMFTITLSVAPVTAKANRYVQEDWFSPSFLMLGPMACGALEGHYEEPVYIKFVTVTNTWTNHVTRKGDVHQTSQLNGIAEIYGYGEDGDADTDDDVLLDTRDFFCHETGIDKGGNNGAWNGFYTTWYDMFDPFTYPPPACFANLEQFNMQWKIQGLYLYKLTIIDGVCVQCAAGVSHEWVHP